MKLMEIFKKQGGFTLLKNYWRTGALFPAIITFLLLGKSRKALEILRLVAQFKINKKLYKMYAHKVDDLLEKYKNENSKMDTHLFTRRIYFCWFQGLDNAPEVIKKCYASLQEHITDREILLITEENYREYVTFPKFIEDKFQRGIITRTHFSDLLRLELLTRYGGTWIDATVLCTATPPAYMLDSDMFLFQLLKPGLDGHVLGFNNWFITAKPNALILCLTLDLLYEYWKKHNVLWDYFLLHQLTEIIKEKCPDEWKKIVPFSDEIPHILLLRLFDTYDEDIWQAIKQQTPFHKLSYKFTESDFSKDNTYYNAIIRSNDE